MAGLGAIGTIIGAGVSWALSGPRSEPPYWLIFATGAMMAACAAVAFVSIRGVGRQTGRPRLIVRRRYWLYYLLCVLFGARKQVFITFGPWVLIKVFHRSVSTFAKLRIVNSLLTAFTHPFIGNLIDRWGERRVLMVDSFLLMVVCLGYGVSHRFGSAGASGLAFACFVLDEVMFGFGMARHDLPRQDRGGARARHRQPRPRREPRPCGLDDPADTRRDPVDEIRAPVGVCRRGSDRAADDDLLVPDPGAGGCGGRP